MADFKLKILESNFTGLVMLLEKIEVHSLLIGSFNAFNLLCAYAVSQLLEVPSVEALTALSKVRPVEGRFDQVFSPGREIYGIVDFAHTPDALSKILDAINNMRSQNEQLITVIGAGGDRDKTKRPLMAEVACRKSSRVILTSDNPRTEDPEAILKDMNRGVPTETRAKVLTITDRREAIRTAAQFAGVGDIVLVAGKGHEHYMEINGVKYPFNDKEILQEALNEKVNNK